MLGFALGVVIGAIVLAVIILWWFWHYILGGHLPDN